jgi:hypothetical protein
LAIAVHYSHDKPREHKPFLSNWFYCNGRYWYIEIHIYLNPLNLPPLKPDHSCENHKTEQGEFAFDTWYNTGTSQTLPLNPFILMPPP